MVPLAVMEVLSDAFIRWQQKLWWPGEFQPVLFSIWIANKMDRISSSVIMIGLFMPLHPSIGNILLQRLN